MTRAFTLSSSFYNEAKENPLRSRTDVAAFLTSMLDALEPHTSPNGARIHLGYTATHFDEVAAQLEGFSRPIWGLASLIAGKGSYPGVSRWRNGLASGTDPESDEFWGNMRDKDQRMVECSAIGYALSVSGKELWDPLSEEAKENIGNWLGGMNDKEMPNTNWLWFRVFANLGLSKVNSPRADRERMKADLDHLDTFYIGDGWSRDGPEGVVQLDYYSSSFAIQVAQLLYSKLAQKEDPKRCEDFRNRARMFALDFIHYFDSEGRAILFGRSLVYRFAMSAFWSALAFAFDPSGSIDGVDHSLPAPLTWGVIKGLQLRNIRYWAHTQPGAFDRSGILTLGFSYPNHNLLESYNSPGSPYWACKAFICLALPESSLFWTSEEEEYPVSLKNTTKVMKHALQLTTNLGGHTYLLSSGQQCSYPVKQSAAKYGKLAYSAAFGYSVPVASLTLEELGGDSTLAISGDGEETWKCRRVTKEARFEEKDGKFWLRSMWYPFPDVEIETWLIPPTIDSPLWYLRVHRIHMQIGNRVLSTAEGGWAIYGQGEDERALDSIKGGEDSESEGTYADGGTARVVSRAGIAGIVDLSPGRVARNGQALRTDANTNLISARAVLPVLRAEYDEKEKDIWIVTAVFGLPFDDGERKSWLEQWKKRPALPEDIARLMD
ncbi:hypothetical protein BDP27DRAFT_1207213 [Rhodocollybia butyracea]|uniref:DUF2264 domain-containing protein n=1 Tax=Rhodocollybia butyracea TaxID=206335 RepID=A0A9P5QC19_9AGAR|nr:hypothetical protein BDP27DRAFT_1207213 [Rhodocollybia butyracea]